MKLIYKQCRRNSALVLFQFYFSFYFTCKRRITQLTIKRSSAIVEGPRDALY